MDFVNITTVTSTKMFSLSVCVNNVVQFVF